MDLTPVIKAAQTVFEIGFGPFLIFIFFLWLIGKLHTEGEKKDWKELYNQERDEKLQAIKDRKDSDDAVLMFTDRLKEHDSLTQRTLDLNERLMEELLNKTPKRRGPA